jgi:chorismate mutase/prephenate dehydratase
MVKDINDNRTHIGNIDKQIVDLFVERMNLAKEIGDYKLENNLAIYDERREKEVLANALSTAPEPLRGEALLLMRSIMSLSREYQRSSLFSSEEELFPSAGAPKTENVKVIFQGVKGAWGDIAARKTFPNAEISSVDFFEEVFSAVKSGESDYGIVPIENSQSGAIGETYDLLRKYGCYIVKRTWIDIRHCLLAKSGVLLKDIREVYSHPEGFRQSHRFLADKPWDLIPTSNTAVAAEKVSRSDDGRISAIGSRLAAELYGLDVLKEDIMDTVNNKTSFVVISSAPEYSSESDLISVTFSLAHRSGSLVEALLPFVAADINLTRIESRPAGPGNFRFFAELDGNIEDTKIADTLRSVSSATEYFEVIGCYNMV